MCIRDRQYVGTYGLVSRTTRRLSGTQCAERDLPFGDVYKRQEQRSIIAGGVGTSRGQPFGFGPRVKTAIDKSTLPEVILKMVFGHSSQDYNEKDIRAERIAEKYENID